MNTDLSKAILLPFALATGLAGTSQTLLFEEFTSASLPTGWTVSGSAGNWTTSTSNCLPSGNRTMQTTGWVTYYPIDTWAFTPGLTLTAGITYALSFKQCMVQSGSPKVESLKITVGTQATVAAQTQTLLDLPSLTNTVSSDHSTTFTPGATGVYHFAFHCYSGYSGVANSYRYLSIDDVRISIPDLVPPTITFTPLEPTCATNARTLTAIITDASGVPTSGNGRPVLYWKNAGAWNAATGTHTGGSGYSFTFGASVSGGDVVQYYIVARDEAAVPNVGANPATGASGFTANPPAASTSPTSPANYAVLSPPTASAGAAQAICVNGTTTGLGGNMPATPATGQWSIVTPGVSGTWSPDESTPNAEFTHTGGNGPFTLRWTVSGPPCTAAFEDVGVALIAPEADSDGDGIVDCDDTCPTVHGQNGDYCDADPGIAFLLGQIVNCACVPISCTTYLVFETYMPDGDNLPIWEVRDAGTHAVVATGGGEFGNGGHESEYFCLPDGNFYIVVGNVPAEASYKVYGAEAPFARIIENTAPVQNAHQVEVFGNSGGTIQLPMSETRVLLLACDKYWWKAGDYLVANEDPDVKNVWDTTASNSPRRANTGYDFWFYDPNGTYSYVRQRRHNQADGYGNVGSTRTCHMRVNSTLHGWPTDLHIEDGLPLNVRVRTVVNGVVGAWGPACRFVRDEATAACPPTTLWRVPVTDPKYSCDDATRNWTTHTNQRIFAHPVSGASQYCYRFENVNEGEVITRTVSTYYLNVGWNANVAPVLGQGSTYRVTVRSNKGGTLGPENDGWCVAGDPCTITICGPQGQNCGGGMTDSGQNSLPAGQAGTAEGPFLRLWPNPNGGQHLWFQLDGLVAEEGAVAVDIHDLSGKRLVARELAFQHGPIMLDLKRELAAGIYVVTITVGEQRYVDRLVIQP